MVVRGHPSLSLSRQCRLLSIGRSSLYYEPKGESAETLALMRRIDELFLKYPFYGARQMVRHLRREGVRIGRRRAARLMRLPGLQAVWRAPRTSAPHPGHRVWPWLLKDLPIERANHVWCADITCIPVRRGFLYLVAIMDWASRHVLAWRLSNTLDAGFCTDALEEALERYGTPEIFNTDQGSQFTGFAFTGRLQAPGIRISMDGRGRCMDNIFIERLWRSLKYEAVYLHEIADGFTARRVIGEWIGFYNTIRPHSALGGRTPAEACRDGLPVGMWTSRSAPCPHTHRRNSSNRKSDSRGFWRAERQPEYTLAQPPGCPTNRGHLSSCCSTSIPRTGGMKTTTARDCSNGENSSAWRRCWPGSRAGSSCR